MITIIASLIIAGFVAFGITEFNDEPSPHVANFMYDVGMVGDYEPKELEWDEVKKELGRYEPEALVAMRSYKIPRAHTLYKNTYSSVCSPFQQTQRQASFAPIGWGSQDYANKAMSDMDGYAIGVAWSFDDPETMVNIGLIETYDGDIKVAFYNSAGCFLTAPPGDKLGIIIGAEEVYIPTVKEKLTAI